jgi:hypothetical protein
MPTILPSFKVESDNNFHLPLLPIKQDLNLSHCLVSNDQRIESVRKDCQETLIILLVSFRPDYRLDYGGH